MKIIFFCLFLLPFLGSGQGKLFNALPIEEGKVTYRVLLQTDNLTKDELFGRIKDWALNIYGSEKASLESEDRQAGFIAYKGYFKAQEYYKGGIWKGKPYFIYVWHTLKFYIKDGKVNMVLSNVETQSNDLTTIYNVQQNLRAVPHYPVEGWGDDLEKRRKYISRKKYLRLSNELEARGIVLNEHVEKLIKSIKSNLLGRQSDFNF